MCVLADICQCFHGFSGVQFSGVQFFYRREAVGEETVVWSVGVFLPSVSGCGAIFLCGMDKVSSWHDLSPAVVLFVRRARKARHLSGRSCLDNVVQFLVQLIDQFRMN